MLREDLEDREDRALAPYAMRSAKSAGRRYAEPEHPYRTCFQRDRDRVIHSKAFRRLEYKTQVFLNHEGDHYRTRLTHTVEVTQISRTIARALGLNEDLTEAIALAHDVGHTPFGHSGEAALRKLMADHGGFEHNAHGLRVVDLLEGQSDFPGLNLTQEVRESIAKHHTRWDSPTAEGFRPGPPLLEAQAVELADSIAYDNHDLQDGLEAGILSLEGLRALELWRAAEGAVRDMYGAVSDEQLGKQATRLLINRFVTDVVKTTCAELDGAGLRSWQDVRAHPGNVVRFSDDLAAQKGLLEDHLFSMLYRDYRVVRVTKTAQRFIEAVFEAYVSAPDQLPPKYAAWADEVGLHQAVCDYVAGMTDRYAQEQYTQLFLPFQKL